MSSRLLFLLMLFVLSNFIAVDLKSAVYYVDSNGNDLNDGLSEQTPWKTILKVNSMMSSITPGSQILFRRGNAFTGMIMATKSGTAGNEIIFGSYGSGDLPVIKGVKSVTGWTVYSGNIYVANFSDTITHLYGNGKLMTIARFPNTKFLKIDNASSTTNFYDAELNQSAGFWNQANCRVRSSNWCYESRTVSNFSGGNITLSSPVQYTIYSKSGYYFDNKLSLLDTANEWYYDKPAGKLYFYAPGGINPNSVIVDAVITRYGFLLSNSSSNVIIQDLKFSGFRENCLELYIANNIKIRRCIIAGSGKFGLRINGNNNVIENNIFEDNLNVSISGVFTNCIISDNLIRRTGLIAGYGDNAWGYHGMQLYQATGTVCRDNVIDSTGYTGMIASKNMLVKNNFVSNSCLILNDGGGIDIDDADGLQIIDNIVINTFGNTESSVSPIRYANGIYFGPNVTKNILIKGNTLANNNYAGINVDNKQTSSNNQFLENIFYNNGYTQIVMTDYSASTYSASYSNIVKRNIFYSLSSLTTCMEHQMFNSSVFSDFGNFDSNYYCNPYTEYFLRRSVVYGTYSTKYYRLSIWKNLFNEDLTSSSCNFSFDQYRVLDTISSNLILNPRFATNLLNWSTTPTAGSSIFHTNNPLLDTGCMKIRWNGSGGPEGMTSCNYITLAKDNYYKLSFDFAGDHTGTFSTFGRPNSGSNPFLFARRYLGYENYRRSTSFVFKPDTTDPNARITFAMSVPDSAVHVDNAHLYKVNAERIDSTLKNTLFYNPTKFIQTYSLGGIAYKNPDGTAVSGSIVLQPFTSRILINDSEVLQKHLSLNLLIQGFYESVPDRMTPDTIKILLRESVSPYYVADSAISKTDSSGKSDLYFDNVINGTNYFLSVHHRNSLETWSSGYINFASNEAVYNFTSSASQAYGNNLIQKGFRFCIYSGDVNNDGTIDGGDLLLIENDAASGSTGYLKTDINGDLVTDGSDLSVTDNNAAMNVVCIKP